MNRKIALQKLDNLFKTSAGFSYLSVKELINHIYDELEVKAPIKTPEFKSTNIPGMDLSDNKLNARVRVVTPKKIIHNIDNLIPLLENKGAIITYDERFKKYVIEHLPIGKLNFFTKSGKLQICKENEWVEYGIVKLNDILYEI